MSRVRMIRWGAGLLISAALVVALWMYRQGPMSARRARESWSSQYNSTWGAWWPRTYDVVRGNSIGDNEQTYYFHLRIPLDGLRSFKDDLLQRSRDGGWSVDDSDDRHAFELVGNDTRPYWWHPELLPDVDAIKIYSTKTTFKFFLSRSGAVYVYRWDV